MVVLLVLLFYASGLFVALSLRHNVLVRIAPVRTTMYRVGPDGQIYNRFRMTIANRQNREAEVRFILTGLPQAQIQLTQPLKLRAAETIQQEFEIAVPANSLPAGVNHFAVTAQVAPNQESSTFEMTFITPTHKPTISH
jgi:hypothetical protein